MLYGRFWLHSKTDGLLKSCTLKRKHPNIIQKMIENIRFLILSSFIEEHLCERSSLIWHICWVLPTTFCDAARLQIHRYVAPLQPGNIGKRTNLGNFAFQSWPLVEENLHKKSPCSKYCTRKPGKYSIIITSLCPQLYMWRLINIYTPTTYIIFVFL